MGIKSGSYLCEAALWVQWFHRGNWTTDSDATFLKLDVKSFHDAVNASGPSRQPVSRFAQEFSLALRVATVDFGDYIMIDELMEAIGVVREDPSLHQPTLSWYLDALRQPENSE